jgi:predicted transcriptional regulator
VSLGLPLYCRIRKDEVLDNFIRGRIFEYIRVNPGSSYNRIMHELGVRNGTLVHHLKMLERHDMIYARRDGIYKRFFPRKLKVPKKAYLSGIQEMILKTITDNPGISQVDIAKELDKPKQVVHYHCRQMAKGGIIRRKKVGRTFKCRVKE